MTRELDHLLDARADLLQALPTLRDDLVATYGDASLACYLTTKRSVSRVGGEATAAFPEAASGVVLRVHGRDGVHEFSSTDATLAAARLLVARAHATVPPATAADRPPAPPAEERTFRYPPGQDPDGASLDDLLGVLDGALARVTSLSPAVTLTGGEVTVEDHWNLFLGPGRHLEQRIPFVTGWLRVYVETDGKTRAQRAGARRPGGLERLEGAFADDVLTRLVSQTEDMCRALPVEGGMHRLLASPAVGGVIAHEAFGHGVEADMVLRRLCRGAAYMDQRVGSDLISMAEAPQAGETTAFYYFDDEGHPAGETAIIHDGILTGLISDELSARRLGRTPSGNGRRVDVRRPVFSRMSCTYFRAGTSSPADLEAALDRGFILDGGCSGQEDPLGWGMQVNVPLAYEVVSGRRTGRVFGPVVLTGYVPDLLTSIEGVGHDLEFRGLGRCGKTFWKDWVPVGMGSPSLLMRGRLA